MRLNKPIAALLLSLVIACSLFAFIQLEKNNAMFNLDSIATSSFNNQLAIENIVKENSPSITDNSTRAEIYDFIVANPAIQFRGICVGLDIAIGTAEFHLGILKRAGLICFVRDGKFKRFFASKKFSLTEMKLLCLLRHETARNIIKNLITEKTVHHSRLASSLSISSQGLSWQMNRLIEEGIVQEHRTGINVTYNLNQTYVAILSDYLNYFE